MRIDRNTILACVVCLVLWNWGTSTGGSTPGPSPRPIDDRPVLKWIARAAKTLLWVSLIAEPPPADRLYGTASVMVDEDGRPMLDHGRGW